MKDLVNIVIPQLADWETVAYTLDYDIRTVETIKNQYQNRHCQELFKDWLSTSHGVRPKTWFTLLNNIAENENFTSAVERILEKLEKKL